MLEVVKIRGTTVSFDVEDVSLAVIDVASPAQAGRELIGASRFPETAAWAPDGSVMVFGALDAPGGNGLDLWAIQPDGTGLRRLTTLADEGGNATHPEVSGDGSSVIFAGSLPGEDGSVLAQVDLNGGEVTSATGTEFIDGVHPRLRPTP